MEGGLRSNGMGSARHQCFFVLSWFSILVVALADVGANREGDPNVTWFVQLSDVHLTEFEEVIGNFRERDVKKFSADILPTIAPSTILITGDLTDSKTRERRSAQRAKDWDKYGRVLVSLQNSTGLSLNSVLDLRGNHDTFDVGARGGSNDYYAGWSASGDKWQDTRVRISAVESKLGNGNEDGCPPALLVGIDMSQDPGLRGPTNFIGLVYESLLQDVEFKISKSRQDMASRGCDPLLIAYGHFTFSTTAYPEQSLWTSTASIEKLEEVLIRNRVSAYLCGHLHEVFGYQLYKIHGNPESGFLAELEAGDWKFARRFRIVAIDGGILSFADLRYKVHSNSQPSFSIEAVADGMEVGHHIVLITSPSDAHFSPLTSDTPTGSSRMIDALVFPIPGLSKSRSVSDDAEVAATWWCSEKDRPKVIANMTKVYGEGPLYRVKLDPEEQLCESDGVYVQVTTRDGMGAFSSSQITYVRTKPATAPEPMSHTTLERAVLGFDWPNFARKVFLMLWSVHLLGMLVLPKLLASNGCFLPPDYSKQSMLNKKDLENSTGGTKALQMNETFKGSSSLASCLLSPLRVLTYASYSRPFWQGQLAYSIYTLFGPLCVARVMSSENLGLLYYYGVSVPNPQTGKYSFINMPDSLFVSIFHTAGSTLPCTMWLAWVIARWMTSPCGLKSKWRAFTIPQLIAGFIVAYIHLSILKQLGLCYGPTAVLLSPSVGLWGPFCLLLLYYSRKEMTEAGLL